MATNTALTTQQIEAGAIERVLIGGDLAALKTDERVSYYSRVCESLGLNPLTQPFAYLNLSGKLILYARKDAAEQLRQLRAVSLRIVSRELIDGMYIVTCHAEVRGRTDEATGVVDLSRVSGEAKANAMMKAETKAKRRVTLSICGLGLMDETEVDSVPGARKVSVEDAHSGKLLNAAPEPAPQAKLDPRPIPDELFDAVTKLRAGDASVIKTATAFLKGEIEQACGTDGPFLKETEAIRKRYPKTNGKETIPPEEMVGMWLDLWAIIESVKFANEVNPA
jgi:hypothetical protein